MSASTLPHNELEMSPFHYKKGMTLYNVKLVLTMLKENVGLSLSHDKKSRGMRYILLNDSLSLPLWPEKLQHLLLHDRLWLPVIRKVGFKLFVNLLYESWGYHKLWQVKTASIAWQVMSNPSNSKFELSLWIVSWLCPYCLTTWDCPCVLQHMTGPTVWQRKHFPSQTRANPFAWKSRAAPLCQLVQIRGNPSSEDDIYCSV